MRIRSPGSLQVGLDVDFAVLPRTPRAGVVIAPLTSSLRADDQSAVCCSAMSAELNRARRSASLDSVIS